jgi:prophage regulatory protein
MEDSILRRPEVQKRTGLPCSTIYEKIKKGEFPRPLKLGARSVGWSSDQINKWIAQRKLVNATPYSGEK